MRCVASGMFLHLHRRPKNLADTRQAHLLGHDLPISLPRAHQRPHVRRAPQRHHLVGRETEWAIQFLGRHRDAVGDLPALQSSDILAVEEDPASPGRQETAEDFEQRRLPWAVGTQEADKLAVLQGEVHVAQDKPVVVGKVHILGLRRSTFTPR